MRNSGLKKLANTPLLLYNGSYGNELNEKFTVEPTSKQPGGEKKHKMGNERERNNVQISLGTKENNRSSVAGKKAF